MVEGGDGSDHRFDPPRQRPSAGLGGRWHAWRDGVRSRSHTRALYRIVVGVVGAVITAVGLVLVPLPGPGWLVVILGLAVLASEFVWADRLQAWVRARLRSWVAWLGRQGWPVRGAVALGTALVVVGMLYLVALWRGVPGWVPDAWVPPLPGLGS